MTHTNQQDVVKAKEKIAELKSYYMDAVSNYIGTSKSDNKENFLAKLLDCQKKETHILIM